MEFALIPPVGASPTSKDINRPAYRVYLTKVTSRTRLIVRRTVLRSVFTGGPKPVSLPPSQPPISSGSVVPLSDSSPNSLRS